MTYVAFEGQNGLRLANEDLQKRGPLHALWRGVHHIVYRVRVGVSDLYRAKVRVPRVAHRAISAVEKTGKRGLFLDCGSNLGQGFSFFKEQFSKQYFDYELFEPNPNCVRQLEKIVGNMPDHNIVLHAAAVSASGGSLKFYGLGEDEGGQHSQGGSLLKEHNSGFYDAKDESSIIVPAVNFPEFINDKSNLYDVIVVKMDIEGGEYDVLDALISKGVIGKIHTIFCEFHSQYMENNQKSVFRQREIDIQQAVEKTPCAFFLWR